MFTFTFKNQESVDVLAAILQNMYIKDMPAEIAALSDDLDVQATGLEFQWVRTKLYVYDYEKEEEIELDGFGVRTVI